MSDRGRRVLAAPVCAVHAFLEIASDSKTRTGSSPFYRRAMRGEMGVGRFSLFTLFNILVMETERDGLRKGLVLTRELVTDGMVKPRAESVPIDRRFAVSLT